MTARRGSSRSDIHTNVKETGVFGLYFQVQHLLSRHVVEYWDLLHTFAGVEVFVVAGVNSMVITLVHSSI